MKTSYNTGHKELQSKYKMLSDLMDLIPDVIYFKDRDGRLSMVNKAHAKGLGLRPEDLIGKTDFDIFPKGRAKKMVNDDKYVMQTGKPIIDKIERATRPDGIDNYVSTTKIPRYDENGNVIGLIGITRDITRRTQVERLKEERAGFEKKLEALEELNKMKSEFISVVSHELRTPLAVIKEAVGLVSDETAGLINDNQKMILGRARNNIERLRHMIDELLDISRIEDERFKLHYSLVNINDLVKETAGYFRKTAEEKGIQLEYKLPKKQVHIFLDAERANQIIANLINNAVKFTEQGGYIDVELKALETKVRIGVLDTGIGIAKSDLPKLFNKFVQVSGIKGLERKGAGLGLSIAKELVEKHSGEIWVESKLGVGSKFFFTLPLLYSTTVLDERIKDRINHLLDKDMSVYLVNLLIINYQEFKKKVKIKAEILFEDIKKIIDTAFRDFYMANKESPQIAVADKWNGEWSMLFPEITEKKVAKICSALKDMIMEYFFKNKIKDIFINIGSMFMDHGNGINAVQEILTNLHIKKIYIGSDARRFKRVLYKLEVEAIHPEDRTELTKTVDISLGGICFISERFLETNANVGIRMKLGKGMGVLHSKARVAWIKNIEQLSGKSNNRYKVGLEFINIRSEERKKLSKFINGIEGAAGK